MHLASLPMDDVEENAAMVNAIQRRADVVLQKSLAEGFGLTVAEAMWKSRPVVAGRIGGIQDQIVDGGRACWSTIPRTSRPSVRLSTRSWPIRPGRTRSARRPVSACASHFSGRATWSSTCA